MVSLLNYLDNHRAWQLYVSTLGGLTHKAKTLKRHGKDVTTATGATPDHSHWQISVKFWLTSSVTVSWEHRTVSSGLPACSKTTCRREQVLLRQTWCLFGAVLSIYQTRHNYIFSRLGWHIVLLRSQSTFVSSVESIPHPTSKWGIKTAVDFSTRATRKYHIFTLIASWPRVS